MSSWSIAALIATLGPWAATELLAVTVTVGAVQIVWMAVLNGGAAARIASMALRVVVMNAVTLGAGTAVYWFGRWAVGDASLWTTLMAGVTASAITASWLQAPAATATAAADAVRTRLAESALFALGAVLLIIGAFVASAPADRESVMAWLAYVGSGALGVSVVSYALLSRWWWPPATGVADAATVAAFQSAPAEPTSGAVVVRNR